MSFQPVVNPPPRQLTPAQIAHYHERGYPMPFDIFTPAEAAANDGRDPYAING